MSRDHFRSGPLPSCEIPAADNPPNRVDRHGSSGHAEAVGIKPVYPFLRLKIDLHIDKKSTLLTGQNYAYTKIGCEFSGGQVRVTWMEQ